MKPCPTKRLSAEKRKSEDGITYQVAVYEKVNDKGETVTTEQITRFAPYDETEYHWAYRFLCVPYSEWYISYRRKLITIASTYTVESVIETLAALDKLKKLRRTGGIY